MSTQVSFALRGRNPNLLMNKPTIEEILAPKPEVRRRVYAYSIDDEAHKGLLKVGQTSRDVNDTPQVDF
ncbi:MAG: hypothetical protein HC886_11125 [Leptolyngbyaceae cyanobacterium SM1_1_3]|nr:hypothetical protein [Leptolyngbyaceae cyanobacterium SM1_1_3]NJN02571.1 hypothetical protein [Leptolyngbyaceae cyanobacterium RM1_1_2]NJO08587.1 hypothetical protein [Leptolyngbyaceae cyanobacterium SL_1_1]